MSYRQEFSYRDKRVTDWLFTKNVINWWMVQANFEEEPLYYSLFILTFHFYHSYNTSSVRSHKLALALDTFQLMFSLDSDNIHCICQALLHVVVYQLKWPPRFSKPLYMMLQNYLLTYDRSLHISDWLRLFEIYSVKIGR